MRGRLCFAINCAATFLLSVAALFVYSRWGPIGNHSLAGSRYTPLGEANGAKLPAIAPEAPHLKWLASSPEVQDPTINPERDRASAPPRRHKSASPPSPPQRTAIYEPHDHGKWNVNSTGQLEDSTPEMVLANLAAHTSLAAPHTTVAIINCVNWHFEIVLGFAQVLHLMQMNTTVFMVTRSSRSETAMDLLRQMDPHITIKECREYKSKEVDPAHLAILVSAQEEIYIRTTALFALRAIKPKVALAIHHNTASYRRGLMAHVFSWHPRMYMMALAPTPLAIMKDVIKDRYQRKPGHFNWILPVYEYKPKRPCNLRMEACHHHFTVQGRLEISRRNYTRLFSGLDQGKNNPRLHVKLVGNFVPEEPLEVPKHLSASVTVHPNLPFQEYYETIHQSVGLLPLFSTDNYIHGSKISSSVITSLICNVPLVASQALLDAYPFLTPNSSYLHTASEGEVELMNKVASWAPQEHALRRKALTGVRTAVLVRTVRVLDAVMQGHKFV